MDRTPANSARALRSLFQDPTLVTSVVILWVLLGLFVLYPLAWLLLRTFTEGGTLTLANLLAILKDPNHRQSFWNSLLLAALVGVAGTALGFFFAFTAVRANLSKAWGTVLDASCLLPLISPPFTTAIAMIFSFGPRGAVQNAKLRVYDTTNGSVNGPAVYGTGTSWTETGITWNNRPSRITGELDNKGSISTNAWVEYNVTSFVTGNGTFSFVLAADSNDAAAFSSRQGSQPPQLVVTTGSGNPDT